MSFNFTIVSQTKLEQMLYKAGLCLVTLAGLYVLKFEVLDTPVYGGKSGELAIAVDKKAT